MEFNIRYDPEVLDFIGRVADLISSRTTLSKNEIVREIMENRNKLCLDWVVKCHRKLGKNSALMKYKSIPGRVLRNCYKNAMDELNTNPASSWVVGYMTTQPVGAFIHLVLHFANYSNEDGVYDTTNLPEGLGVVFPYFTIISDKDYETKRYDYAVVKVRGKDYWFRSKQGEHLMGLEWVEM